jgi:hypothetical protein
MNDQEKMLWAMLFIFCIKTGEKIIKEWKEKEK